MAAELILVGPTRRKYISCWDALRFRNWGHSMHHHRPGNPLHTSLPGVLYRDRCIQALWSEVDLARFRGDGVITHFSALDHFDALRRSLTIHADSRYSQNPCQTVVDNEHYCPPCPSWRTQPGTHNARRPNPLQDCGEVTLRSESRA